MLLLPPSLEDWLPEGHLARFISDVVGELELRAICQSYEEKDGRGQAAYHPVMLVKLLLYGYCVGVVSSRKIEAATYDHVAFRYLAANEHPDHDSIAEFRRRHLPAMMALFLEVLKLCQKAGLVKLGHVALDGTKIKANASRAGPKRAKPPRSGYGPDGIPRIDHLRAKLATPEGQAVYARRREIVEPVFGQIQQWRCLRQFLMRGLAKTRAEWRLICLTHNLLKLYRFRLSLQTTGVEPSRTSKSAGTPPLSKASSSKSSKRTVKR